MGDKDLILKAGSYHARVKSLFESPQDLLLKKEVHTALLQAEQLLSQASREALIIKENARQEGLKEGLEQMLDIIRSAEEHRQEILRQARGEVIPLAMATAQKLIGKALRDHPEWQVNLVEQALREVTSARKLTLWVAPMADEVILGARQQLKEGTGIPSLSIETDDSLAPGDCIIETEVGRIDARIAVQLETILRALQSGGPS